METLQISTAYLHDTLGHMRRILWVRTGRKACWLASCKMRLNGILHFTNLTFGHARYLSGMLNSMEVWVLEHRVRLKCNIIVKLKMAALLIQRTEGEGLESG